MRSVAKYRQVLINISNFDQGDIWVKSASIERPPERNSNKVKTKSSVPTP
jgi:hypothetical protein